MLDPTRQPTRSLLIMMASLSVLLAVSCASLDWTGRSIDEVIGRLGQPTRIETRADGLRVFVWVTRSEIPGAPQYDSQGKMVGRSGGTYMQSTKVFVVDPEGLILQAS